MYCQGAVHVSEIPVCFRTYPRYRHRREKLVLETLVRLNRELGMTVVIVSSELQELKSVSDRIAIVSEGKLVDILSPQAPDADYGLAMSGIKPSEHIEKGGTEE